MSVNQFVEKFLGIDMNPHNDPSLMQGAEFNILQKRIINNTLPDLPLMEQTTMPGLGSIVESLGNQDSTKTPLEFIDKKEFNTLKELEIEFNQKLTEYVAAYKNNLENIVTTQNASGENSELNSQVSRLNEELLSISNRMWEQTQNLHTTDTRLKKAIYEKRTVLRNQMQKLQDQHQQHQRIKIASSTLKGEIEDNRLQLDSAYVQYLVCFFAASTLAAVAFHQVTKNKI